VAELRKVWEAAGSKSAGTWEDVFGTGPETDEIFMAWNYARYIDRVAGSGPKPNILCPCLPIRGSYTGRQRAGRLSERGTGAAGARRMAGRRNTHRHFAPDVYLPNFAEWCGRFHRGWNPLFVPESRGDAGGAANAFYAIGQHDAIGYSPFGIDNSGRLVALRPDGTQQPPANIENMPLPKAYAILSQLSPLILEHQGKGEMAAVSLNRDKPEQTIELGNYKLNVDLRRNRRRPDETPDLGYGIMISTGPDEYVIAGNEIQITFTPNTPGPPIAGLGRRGGRQLRGRALDWQDAG